MITDGAYTTYWDSYTSYNPWVIIRSEEPMYGLYLCFRKMPESFEIQVPGTENGEWIPLMEGDTRFHHTFYELNGLTELRIYSTQKDTHQMGFNEIMAVRSPPMRRNRRNGWSLHICPTATRQGDPKR